MSRINRNPTFDFARGVLYWVYKWKHELYNNPNFNNEPWEAYEEWSLHIGVCPKDYGWFKRTNLYYDGNKVKAWSFFGVTVGWTYIHQAYSLVEPELVPFEGGFDMEPFGTSKF